MKSIICCTYTLANERRKGVLRGEIEWICELLY